jgi:4-amino-4-deoxy-L-arabinose transferase-like glycosyltransferase
MNNLLKKVLENKYLILIFLIGFFLRFYHLGSMPIATHLDEIMNAYVGKFTLINGVDLYGNKWPIFYFNNFGDYPNIIPMYLSGLSALLLGNTEFAIRLPIAIFGSLSIFIVYFLAKLFFKSKKTALFSALTIAVMPWHIVLSRATAEGVTAAFAFLVPLYFLLKNRDKKISIASIVSFLFLIFTYLLYPSYRIIVPLALLPLSLLTNNKQKRVFLILITIISFGLTFYISQTPAGKGRFDQTSIISSNSPILPYQSEFITGEGFDNALKARILFNKPVMFGREFLRQYSSYFSTNFLFSDGGMPKRYFVPDQGLWYYSYLGIFVLFIGSLLVVPEKLLKYNKKIVPDKKAILLISYLAYLTLISLVPAALTYEDSPNIHRASLFPLMLAIWSGLPFIFLSQFKFKKRSLITIIFGLFIVLESLYFWNKYLVHADKYQEIHRNGSSRNLVKYLTTNKDNYDFIYVDGRNDIPLYYPFFNNIYDKNLTDEFQIGMRLKQIDNIKLFDDNCFNDLFGSENIKEINQHNLYIMKTSCIPDSSNLVRNGLELVEQDMIFTNTGNKALTTYTIEEIK